MRDVKNVELSDNSIYTGQLLDDNDIPNGMGTLKSLDRLEKGHFLNGKLDGVAMINTKEICRLGYIKEGVFGKVTHGTIFVRWGHGDDYYNSAAWRGTWKSDGGALMNQTIHAIDLLVWLMGTKPVEATSMISQRLRKIEAEDLGMAILKMDDNSLASIEGTTATSEKEHAAMFTVFCENGTVSLGLNKGLPSLNIRLNGKKKNIKRKDLLIFAESCGLAQNAAGKMIDMLVQKINQQFPVQSFELLRQQKTFE